MKILLHFLVFLVLAAGLSVVLAAEPKEAADPKVDHYTCPMHLSVHLHDPKAKCPICAMDLVPVLKRGAAVAGGTNEPNHPENAATTAPDGSEFEVPRERQQQFGVTYAKAVRIPLRDTIRAVGTVAANRARLFEFVARVEGYVQTLNVASAGEPVEEGQALLTLYSPDLLATETELVKLLEARDRAGSADARATADRLLEASRRRLAQWNILPAQIAELEKARVPADILTLRSPFRGLVAEVTVDQGRRVAPGDRLVSVVDLSSVWVWAEFYENELPLLNSGQAVSLTSAAYPGRTFEGSIAVIQPYLGEMRRTARVRIDLANADLSLRPGMFLETTVVIERGEALTIPFTAVMPTGGRSLVFVDRGGGRLLPRFVQLGRQHGDAYEVLAGLKEGERVVNSANFLIDAEAKVQGVIGATALEEPVAPRPERAPMASPMPSAATTTKP